MKISGFSMCRNADKLYYPVKQSITSILPIVDEFVIAVGKGDPDDRTLETIRSIGSDKIRIIETEWDLEAFPHGTVHAQQTDLAKSHCTGDWLFYLQADEVLHERYHQEVLESCRERLHDRSVEGLLFDYIHFWGDYNHYQDAHSWYDREIRIIRNRPDIHSWKSAQSFRVIPGFDGRSYWQKQGTRKLKVVRIDAKIHHYGWVRPPDVMTRKMNELDRIHSHPDIRFTKCISYGNLDKLPRFSGTHPAVMHDWIARFDWQDTINDRKECSQGSLFRHDRWRVKLLTFIERHLLQGRRIFGSGNYKIVP